MKARVLPALAALSLFAACSMPDAPTSPSAAPSVSPSFSQNPNDEIQNDPKVRVHLAQLVQKSQDRVLLKAQVLNHHLVLSRNAGSDHFKLQRFKMQKPLLQTFCHQQLRVRFNE